MASTNYLTRCTAGAYQRISVSECSAHPSLAVVSGLRRRPSVGRLNCAMCQIDKTQHKADIMVETSIIPQLRKDRPPAAGTAKS